MNILLRRRKLGRTSCREIASNTNGLLRSIRNDQRIPEGQGYLFRWGTTSNVPTGYSIVNTAEAIHIVNNKKRFRETIGTLGPRLHTAVPPEPFAVVVRPLTHAQGRNLFVETTPMGLRMRVQTMGGWDRVYVSDLIKKVAEYRVMVIQGRAAWVARKTPGNPEDVAWNVARGGRFDNVNWGDWPLRVVKAAIEAFNLSGLNFGGVDVMVDEEGKPYVLEINSAPSQTSPYRQACTAACFRYIIENKSKENIPLIEEKGGYRKFIHPAVCADAQLT